MNGVNGSSTDKGEQKDEKGKIFVGGLSWDTTQPSLLSYFSRYGEVKECVVVMNPSTGKSRGFGFVTFAEPACVETVQAAGPHILDGKQIDPNGCNRKKTGKGVKPNEASKKKLFIGGLPANVDEAQLREGFSKYGKINDVVIVFDQQKQRPRGFGFMTFESEESVDKIVRERFVQICGKQVECKRAEPRDVQLAHENSMAAAALATGSPAMMMVQGPDGSLSLLPAAAAGGGHALLMPHGAGATGGINPVDLNGHLAAVQHGAGLRFLSPGGQNVVMMGGAGVNGAAAGLSGVPGGAGGYIVQGPGGQSMLVASGAQHPLHLGGAGGGAVASAAPSAGSYIIQGPNGASYLVQAPGGLMGAGGGLGAAALQQHAAAAAAAYGVQASPYGVPLSGANLYSAGAGGLVSVSGVGGQQYLMALSGAAAGSASVAAAQQQAAAGLDYTTAAAYGVQASPYGVPLSAANLYGGFQVRSLVLQPSLVQAPGGLMGAGGGLGAAALQQHAAAAAAGAGAGGLVSVSGVGGQQYLMALSGAAAGSASVAAAQQQAAAGLDYTTAAAYGVQASPYGVPLSAANLYAAYAKAAGSAVVDGSGGAEEGGAGGGSVSDEALAAQASLINPYSLELVNGVTDGSADGTVAVRQAVAAGGLTPAASAALGVESAQAGLAAAAGAGRLAVAPGGMGYYLVPGGLQSQLTAGSMAAGLTLGSSYGAQLLSGSAAGDPSVLTASQYGRIASSHAAIAQAYHPYRR